VSEHDPLDIRGQERAEADKRLRERIAQEAEEADIRRLMTSKWGRRFLWRLMDQAGVFRLSYAPDAMAMAFAEGNRNTGLRILAMVTSLCPEHYPAMLKENTDDRSQPDSASANNQ
jgi:alkylation response protein AidB-like acyl-CoA dehydrogenase